MSGIDPTLFGPIIESAWFRNIREQVRDGDPRLAVTGLVEGSRALTLTLLARGTGRRILLVVPDDVALEAYHRDLAALSKMMGGDPNRIVPFPAMDADPYDLIPPHPEVAKDRVVALGRLARGEVDVLLVPARALLGWLPSQSLRSTVITRPTTLML